MNNDAQPTQEDYRVPVDVKKVFELLKESDCIPETYKQLLNFIENL